MLYHVVKTINVSGIGTIKPGREVELNHHVAALYLPSGAIEAVKTRELRENPDQPDGGTLSASPAGQVSQQTTASASSDGALPRRRGRPPKVAR
jgi:hypothetical protein